MARRKHSKQNAQDPAWYRSITEIPMQRFIDCDLGKPLTHLVISGHPAESSLVSSWNDIQIEFAEALGDDKYARMLRLKGKFLESEMKVAQARMLIGILTMYYTPQFHHRANELFRFKFQLNPDHPQHYDAEIEKMQRRLSSFILEQSVNQEAFVVAEKKATGNAKGGKTNRQYYQRMRMELSNFYSRDISYDQITAFEYTELYKAARAQMKNNGK